MSNPVTGDMMLCGLVYMYHSFGEACWLHLVSCR